MTMPMLILLAVWQFGAPMVIFLAGLKQIPAELYEAASVDGAGPIRRFVKITLPMLSPVLFFNLLLETIHAFQVFSSAFIISGGTGGPADSTLFYTLYLYFTRLQGLPDGLRLGDGLDARARRRRSSRPSSSARSRALGPLLGRRAMTTATDHRDRTTRRARQRPEPQAHQVPGLPRARARSPS